MREINFRAWMDSEKRMIPWGELCDVKADVLSDVLNRVYLHDVMQYTGLKDKNGQEIYEGDVCKDDQGYLFEVKFGKLPLDKSGDCVCTYEAFYLKGYGKLGFQPSHECEEIGSWHEVIGNIWENPEMLDK